MPKGLLVHPTDNCLVALENAAAGTPLSFDAPALPLGDSRPSVLLQQDITFGHKVARQDLVAGELVRKYGSVIGRLTADVRAGEHIHTHNLTSLLNQDYAAALPTDFPSPNPGTCELTFEGYERLDGRVGIRNDVWVINTVSCVNTLSRQLQRPGVVVFEHPYGCSQMGEDLENLTKVLANLVRHPNCGGALILGLGCENLGSKKLMAALGEHNLSRVRVLVTQEVGDEHEAADKILQELLAITAQDKRTTQPASKLCIGVKCGGSDGLSGLTANPLIGRVTDLWSSFGGGILMGEIPEMFGAETTLLDRCVSEDTHQNLVNLFKEYRDYYTKHGVEVYANPSPGNKEGGITTLEEKSLGATQKSGTALVQEVLRYGEQKKSPGLTLADTPGNDLVSSTGLIAAGAQILLFSTGRGTPLAPLVPTIKISTNNRLATNKAHWVDFNAGPVAETGALDTYAHDLVKQILAVASGQTPTRNEQSPVRDFGFFKTGVFL